MTTESGQYGILGYSAYVPKWRIARKTISDAIGWSRGMSAPGKGHRSFAHWDEDTITMAVEAGRPLMNDVSSPDSMLLASTSLPFADRSNSGIVSEALSMEKSCNTFDLAGSRRSATSWLAGALRDRQGSHLLIASDCVDAKPGSESELLLGHGSAGLLVGNGDTPAAVYLGSRSLNEDFVDQYRMSSQRFDYRLESRWIRDEGTRKQVSELISGVLNDVGKDAGEVDFLIVPAPESFNRMIARDSGLADAKRPAELEQSIGLCATAQPLLGLCWALENAEEGQLILLVGLGQGVDVVLLQVTGENKNSGQPLGAQTEPGEPEENYSRYLGLRGLMDIDGGIRAERDNRSAHSAHYRRHDDLTGFVGGRCEACGQLQFPRTKVCVECRAENTQAAENMSGLEGTINSYTEDWLAYTARPPLIFGSVHFEGGANLTMEFGDFLPGEAEVGKAVRMAFRIKDLDEKRHFQRYFWKPVPAGKEADHG